MQQRTRYASSMSAVSFDKRPPCTVERGRQRSLAVTSASPLYSQRSFSSRSRAASSGGRRASSSVDEGRVEMRSTSTSGRQRGGSGVASSERHVSFIADGGNEEQVEAVGRHQRGNYLCPSTSLTHKNGSGSSIRSGGTNQVHQLLSELVTISHTLAAYLQDSSACPPLSLPPQQQDQWQPLQQSDSQNGSVNGQQQAKLKAQEIERIVKRVESHFSAKIASMEQREKEQAEVISKLVQELNRVKNKENQPPSSALSSTGIKEHQVAPPYDSEHQQQQTEAVREANQDDKSSIEEVGYLRRMLQEEKRQRLFVEEQTQSLTEQHGRVVSTLERRLQKQEEQLRDLITSLERQQPFSSSSPNPHSAEAAQSSFFPTAPTPRRLLRQQLPQPEQMQHAFEAHHRSIRGSHGVAANNSDLFPPGNRVSNGHDDGDDELIAELGHTDGVKPVVPNAGCAASVQTKLSYHPPSASLSPPSKPSSKGLQSYGYNGIVTDATTTKAAKDVDDIAAFLDNITQELESIDAIESRREVDLTEVAWYHK